MRKLAVASLAVVLVGSASVGAVQIVEKKSAASKVSYQVEAEKANEKKEKAQQHTEPKGKVEVEDLAIITDGEKQPDKIESSVVDDSNHLILNIYDGTRFYGASGDGEEAKSYYSIHPQVVGKGIASITYTVKDGVFYKKIEKKESEVSVKEEIVSKEYVGSTQQGDGGKECFVLKEKGSSYTVSYEEQDTIDHLYALEVSAKLKGEAKVEDGRIATYGSLAEELATKKIDVVIRYKDGHTVNKTLVFEKNKDAKRPQKVTMHWN